MGNSRRLKRKDIEKIVKLYTVDGASIEDISKRLKISKTTVKNKLVDLGYIKVKKYKRLSESEIKQIEDLSSEGKSNIEIANTLGISKEAVRRKVSVITTDFTNDEIEKMVKMSNAGMDHKAIAIKLNRYEHAIKTKLANLVSENKNGEWESFYSVGKIVNGNLKIVEHTHTKQGSKAYMVQSLTYPKAPQYVVTHSSLKNGKGCAYTSGRRIFEGNSLYSKVEFDKYIRPQDVEYSKTVSSKSNKRMIFKCDNCDREKEMRINQLVNYGIACPYCSSNTTFPELFILAYLEVKEYEFEYQKQLDNSLRKFDIYLPQYRQAIEMNGMAHYQELTGSWKDAHKNSVESDEFKRKYCKENNIKLIEIDARYSDFEYVRKSIKECAFLPNITDDESEKMFDIIEKLSTYDVKTIIRLYVEEKKTTTEIGEIIGKNSQTVSNILSRNNIPLRNNRFQKLNLPIDEIIKMREDGLSQSAIAKKFECSTVTIGRLLKNNSVISKSDKLN